jgi:hypothetical protein
MTAVELVALTRAMLANGSDVSVGRWSRATALLTRQALEASLDELWAARSPGIAACSTRAQLLCLPTYLGDGDLADRTAWTWWALSQACHFHAYELAPTVGELNAWLETVAELATAGATKAA